MMPPPKIENKVSSNHFDERAGANDEGQRQLGVGAVINQF